VFPTDHHAVEFSIKLKFKRCEPVPRKVFDFNRGNFDEFRSSLLRILPDFTMSTDSIDDCWLKWKKLFLGAVGKFVPTKTISLLCIINKVLEHLVGNGQRAQVKHVITTLQHGFSFIFAAINHLG
jgi:hypothetical protein